MDYGAHLKQKFGNLNRSSKHYTKQSKFSGSNRQLRGRIIKLLVAHESLEYLDLVMELQLGEATVQRALVQLEADGLVVRQRGKIKIATY